MKKTRKKKTDSLRIIPLGGLGEVGRNMMLLEYRQKILIIDIGFRMPEEDMPGIDYIIPNAEYLKKRRKDILGVLITHGHYDHIGAIPYLMDKIYSKDLKIYASPLAKGIILKRQEDFPEQPKLNVVEMKDRSKIQLGEFKLEAIRLNHNIPDNLAYIIETPVGNIFHTSDFKFDDNPINDKPTDFKRLKAIAKRKILLLMSDSTGAEEEGHSLSEKEIFKNLEQIFKSAPGRIIAATFASLINRIQQIITISEKQKRRVVFEGHSMRMNMEISKKLGYIKAKDRTFINAKQIKNYPDNQITILTTGAQGEPNAALMRIANREHKVIKIHKNDSVILSSSVIPGNERSVQMVKDQILRQGARVFHYGMMDIHAGGHAQRDELRQMIRIMKPKLFMPIHGQFSMLYAHAELAIEEGIKDENIIVAENGQMINLSKTKMTIGKEKVPANYVMVDGLGVGDVGEIVLRDRQMLAKEGMFVIVAVVDKKTGKVMGSPDIISRGFVYLRESKELLAETRKRVISIINKTTSYGGAVNWSNLKEDIKSKIGKFLFFKTKRRPIILPVVIEV